MKQAATAAAKVETTPEPLTADVRRRFAQIAAGLSPENLFRDGEASRGEVSARYRDLKDRWRSLEREVGREVDDSEVYAL